MILILFYLQWVSAQVPVCTGTDPAGFNACLTNILPSGNVLSSCSALINQKGPYYSCLCDNSKNVVYCYQHYCITDKSNYNSATSTQNSYCPYAAEYNPVVTTNAAPSKNTETSNPVKSTIESTNTTNTTIAAAQKPNSAPIFKTSLSIMSLLLLIMAL